MTAHTLLALASLHFQHKLIHNDIKPTNILVHKLPNGSTLYKLTDFGSVALSISDAGVFPPERTEFAQSTIIFSTIL